MNGTLTKHTREQRTARKIWPAMALLCVWTVCPAPAVAQRFAIEHVADTLNILTLKTDSTADRWPLPYPVYQFCTGDVDGDGCTDALVGVEKSTRYDARVARRLFIFKNYRGRVRPLWLGSRLGRPLYDFCFVDTVGEPRIRSIEHEADGTFLVAEYRWKSFGLEFISYLCRGVELSDAKRKLYANP